MSDNEASPGRNRRPDRPPTGVRRHAAYGAIGAALGALVVWLVADGFSLAALGSGLLGGAVAGVIAGVIRSRAGLDQ